jgi:hypothetical protein
MAKTVEWFSADVPIAPGRTQSQVVAARKDAETFYTDFISKEPKWRDHKPKFKWDQPDFTKLINHVVGTLESPDNGGGSSGETVTTTATARVKPPPPPPAPPPSL